jgi:hypothetical protein
MKKHNQRQPQINLLRSYLNFVSVPSRVLHRDVKKRVLRRQVDGRLTLTLSDVQSRFSGKPGFETRLKTFDAVRVAPGRDGLHQGSYLADFGVLVFLEELLHLEKS